MNNFSSSSSTTYYRMNQKRQQQQQRYDSSPSFFLSLVLLVSSFCHFTSANTISSPLSTTPISTSQLLANDNHHAIYKSKSKSSLPFTIIDSNDVSSLSSSSSRALVVLRGGATNNDDDEEEEEDDDYYSDDGEIEDSSVVDTVMDVLIDTSKKIVVLVGRVTLETAYALQRAVEAGLSAASGDGDDDGEEEEGAVTIMVKIKRIVSSMLDAALHVPADEENEDEEGASVDDVAEKGSASSSSSSKNRSRRSSSKASSTKESETVGDSMGNFGAYLIKAYNIDNKEEFSKTEIVKGGSLSDALRLARSQARLLVVFIPSSPPPPPQQQQQRNSKKRNSYDEIAIRSLTSLDVASVAKKKSIKTKSKNGGGKTKFGSFVLWSTKAGSSEAVLTMKRLKVKKSEKKKGNKDSPTLAVVYPAQVIDSSGRPKLVPRVLSQHHCNPPPTSESMAAWLNALRKRHAKQYASMQHEIQELQYFQERKEGYKESMVDDTKREKREQIAKQEKLAKEKAEKERLEQLQRRRKELRDSLPEEPSSDAPNVMTIALRFADGRTGRRRFDGDTELNELFNWVDGFFDMEREKVILSTMNGQRSFTFVGGDGAAEAGEEDEEERSETMTLKEAGLGRMTGLRVTERKEEEEQEEDEEDE